jgi:predicted DNA-binding antitoxin AbrB/MazE fold protein
VNNNVVLDTNVFSDKEFCNWIKESDYAAFVSTITYTELLYHYLKRKGIFKPLEKVNMKEGEKLKIKIEKKTLLFDIVKKYKGYFEDIEEDLAGQLISERR